MPQVEWVMRRLPAKRQTMLFSATLDGEVDHLRRHYLTDPLTLEVEADTEYVEEMEHRFIGVHQLDKVKVIEAISRGAGRTLVFVRTKRGADRLVLQLERERVKAAAIQAYMQGGAAQQLSLLIPAAANEIGLRGTYVKSVTASTNDAVDALHATKTELGILQGQLTAAQADAARSVTQVASAQKAAAAADAQISAAYASAQAQLGQALADARQAELVANQHRVQTAQARRIGPTTVNLLPLPPPGAGASSAIAWAKAELGKPYVYGGGGPDSFDCSGLTAWAWGHAGHSLPHSSEQQYYNTTHLSVDQLQPGDLVFFGMPPHHVGIYVGGGQMINALHSGTNVEYDSIYMEGDLIGGGRVN
jgi:cell wall-associated NlpC family hydrolase